MEQAVVRVTLSLVGPGILTLFGIVFGACWLVERRRVHLLLMAAACALVAIGATVQVVYWPRDTGLNAMISGLFYTGGVLAAAEGIVRRSGRSLGLCTHLVAVTAIMGLLWYFFYIDRSLIARVYIQNLGYGMILLAAALRISKLRLRRSHVIDRILFWTLLAFALHFFPRTIFTIGFSAPVGAAAFANSLFWQALQLSLAVLGTALAMAVLAATVSDLVEDIRRDRDLDHLTGVLNRRGFEASVKLSLSEAGTRTASLIICDLDDFKSVNDTYGHVVGDQLLQRIASILQQSTRKQDIVGRVGGEEFAIFLPDTPPTKAFEHAEHLRSAILNRDFSELLDARRVSASFGVSSEKDCRFERLYRNADNHLYEAKRAGRNQTWPRPVAAGRNRSTASHVRV